MWQDVLTYIYFIKRVCGTGEKQIWLEPRQLHLSFIQYHGFTTQAWSMKHVRFISERMCLRLRPARQTPSSALWFLRNRISSRFTPLFSKSSVLFHYLRSWKFSDLSWSEEKHVWEKTKSTRARAQLTAVT